MKNTSLFVVLLSTSLAWPAAASDAEKFGARRWPAAPALAVNAEPALCPRLLSIAAQEFLSNNVVLNVGDDIDSEFVPVTMEVIEGGESNGQKVLYRADLDLDGDGRKQTVIYRDNPFNWSGNWHYSYVFPSPAAFEAAKPQVLAKWKDLPRDDQYLAPKVQEFGAQTYFPGAIDGDGKIVSTGNVWAEHHLFEHAGRYYFYFASNEFDLNFAERPLPIYRLRASGHIDLACRIEFPETRSKAEALRDRPAMKAFLSVIHRIGYAGEDRGTMHAEYRHETRSSAAEVTAATRPWVLGEFVGYSSFAQDYNKYGPRMKEFLESWSYQDPWSRREYQLLQATMNPAAIDYANFIALEFGIPYAAALAVSQRSIEGLIGSRITVPSGYSLEDRDLYFPASSLRNGSYLRKREEFDAAFELQSRNARSLHDAIEWPYGLDRLLKAKIDRNQNNGYGKTPLMTAAHLDRIDAVRRLLQAGADVNARTGEGDGFKAEIKVTQRTALMYAAENASPVIIKALLDAGADSKAVDSRGEDAGAYLSRNPRFTADEIKEGVGAVAAMANSRQTPGFDCTQARAAIERQICGNENLRVVDGEISRAYIHYRLRGGLDAIEGQRNWLRLRDKACGKTADPDCLAETLRTRLRYLHLRLSAG